MNKKMWIGGILGGLVLFIWMGISWMVLPWHCPQLKKFQNEQQVAAVLQENSMTDGVYILPNMCGGLNNPEVKSIKDRGFFAFVSVTKQGYRWTSATPYILSVIVQIIAALIATYLIAHHALKNYWNAVWRFVLLGIVIGLMGVLPAWNWWSFNFSYVAVEMIDLIIGWFLAGLVISAVYKR